MGHRVVAKIVQQRTVEPIVDGPVPQIMNELVELIQLVTRTSSHDRMLRRVLEQLFCQCFFRKVQPFFQLPFSMRMARLSACFLCLSCDARVHVSREKQSGSPWKLGMRLTR